MNALLRVSPSRSPSPLTVLFVDPDRAGVEALVRSVPAIAAHAIVSSAQEALSVLQANMPRLLVTELTLADASGIELIRHVHQLPATRHLLVIVMTARSAVADKVAAFQAGADEYLVKPVDPDVFAVRARLLMSFSRLFLC